MKTKLYITAVITLLAGSISIAQNVGISATGVAPSGDAGLDVNFTDKGVLIPRVNLTNTGTYNPPITGGSGPTTSMLVYNTNAGIAGTGAMGVGYYYWNGTRWVRLLAASSPSDAWLTLGNAGTTWGTNFLGTTDAQGLDIRTNNINRIRIDQNGFVGVNTTPSNVYQFAVVSTTNAITGQTSGAGSIGVYGRSTSNTGFGINGFNADASGTGVFGSGNNITGIYLTGGSGGAFSSTNVGVFGYGDATSLSYGVYGESAAIDGVGVFAYVNGATANGVYAINNNTSGTGLVAGGNGTTPSILTVGSGGAFTGLPYGIAVFKNGNLINNQFAGYFIASTSANVGVVVAGRLGGTNYKILNVGAFGGNVSSDVWGLSNDPKDRKIIFCPEAPEILLQDVGKGKLVNGKAHIDLDPIFSKNIYVDDDHPLRVFIQLRGNCNGVYTTNENKYGFDVIELNNGNSNVEFNYFVVANRDDYIHPQTKEIISKHVGVRFPPAPNPEDIKEAIKPEKKKEQIKFER